MSYPTVYNVTYSYTGFQMAQGNNSFPGTQLDADLQGLKSSLSNLALFTQGVMRADGALNNGLVTYDSLSPALQTAGLAPALPWTTATAYAQSSNVVVSAALYRCLVAHTSGVFATDLLAGKWLLVTSLPIVDTRVSSGVVYAYDSGARPDGSDASPALQAAIGVADSAGGPVVRLAAGTFKLNSQVFLNKWSPVSAGLLSVPGLKIKGAGKGVTFLDTNVANGYAIAVNPAWRAAHLSMFLASAAAVGGTLGTNTYYVQITKTDPLGNEIFVTLPKPYVVTGPTGAITIPLQATSPGYTYNIYLSTSATPANYATAAGSNAVLLPGGQTVVLTAVGGAHALPTDKRAIWQEAEISDLTIISSSNAANATGVMFFRAGYSTVSNVVFKGLRGDGFFCPAYTGDIDGSFVVRIKDCKFDGVAGWGIDTASAALEFSNFVVEDCAFNLCGTLPTNLNTNLTVASITNSATPVVGTTVAHNLVVNDQVYINNAAGMALPLGWYRAGTILSGLTFNLVNLDGSVVDTTALGVYTPNSATVSLSWRPPIWNPSAAKTSGSGGIAYLGLISTFRNLAFTQCNNVGLYASENGSSDNLKMESIDFENTAGKGAYIAATIGGSWNHGEILSGASLGATIAGIQLGTGFGAGAVKNFDIASEGAIKVRSDVVPMTAFEQFQNTSIGATYVNTVRAHRIEWTLFDVAGQVRFNGFVFDPIPGQVQFLISAANTAKLVPIGYGGTLPLRLKLGEWTAFHLPNAGITTAIAGGLTPSTSYNFYAYNSAAAGFPAVLQLTALAAAPALNEGYNVCSTDGSLTFVGTWTTDGAGNFQSGGAGTSFYPPTNPNVTANDALKFPLVGGVVTGALQSNSSAGVGYATGAGGTVAQATSKATGVTLNKASGQITLNNAALAAATIVSFVLTDTAIAATDVLILNHISGGTPGSYSLNARCGAGTATIDVRNNTAGSLSEAIVIQFALVKAVNA